MLPLLLVSILINSLDQVNTQGLCGNTTTPTSSLDCIGFSNSTFGCCLLTAVDSPATFSTCYLMKKSNASPIVTVGSIVYRVDCTGMEDYSTYFPFEGKYQACGMQRPSTPSDCFSSGYLTEGNTCCLATTTIPYTLDLNPTCYIYNSKGNDFNLNQTYTETHTGMNLYFTCAAVINQFNFYLTLILFIML